MHTRIPDAPSRFFANREAYAAFIAAWKHEASKRADSRLTALHYAIYTLLTGKALAAAFTPVSNPVKLANGRRSFLHQIPSRLEQLTHNWRRTECQEFLKPFGGTVNREMLQALSASLGESRAAA